MARGKAARARIENLARANKAKSEKTKITGRLSAGVKPHQQVGSGPSRTLTDDQPQPGTLIPRFLLLFLVLINMKMAPAVHLPMVKLNPVCEYL